MRRFLQSTLYYRWGWILLGLFLFTGNSQQPGSPPGAAPANVPITLNFPEEGERLWWVEDPNGNPLSAPTKVSDKKVIVQPKAKAGKLCVQDVKTGNLARFDIGNVPGNIEFKSDSWTHAVRVRVELKANDKPVAGAVVTLKDKSGKPQSRVLEPTALGIVEFERVALGNLKIEARFDDGTKVSNDLNLKAERAETVPVFKIGVSGNVPTVDVPTAASTDSSTSKPASPVEEPEQPRSLFSTIGVIVLFMIATGLTIGVLFLLVKLAMKHEQPLSDAMAKMGVQLPQTGSNDPDDGSLPIATATAAAEPIVPEGFCAFCGQKKDPTTGACACTIGASPSVAGGTMTTAGTLTGVWRLVGLQGTYAGQVFEIRDDLVVIGREATNPIALSNDTAISRRHAQLIKQGDTLLVQDLGSSNGTYVNGMQITSETILRPGDTVQFGGSTFKVEG
jgi:hypothetical protein